MIQGAIILFCGIAIGYFFGYNKELLSKTNDSVNSLIKKPFVSKKGIVVDLTPPIDLDEPINDNKE